MTWILREALKGEGEGGIRAISQVRHKESLVKSVALSNQEREGRKGNRSGE